MHGHHNINYTLKQYNQVTAITRNEYVIFLDSWSKKSFKIFPLHGNETKKILPYILQIIILQNIIRGYILSIYRQIKRHSQYRLYYLRCPFKSLLIQKIPIWKNSATHSPLLECKDAGDPGHRLNTDIPWDYTKWCMRKSISWYLKEALQHRRRWEKLTPIFGLHGNISKCSGHISFFRHIFTRQQPMHYIWLNQKHAVALHDIVS